ncbi:MAG TPA: gamma-glutamyl-gamma-aminobutyrate hydrolase family protein [Thermodesulfobacteriota bacterium]|nr:gamma-glutamyl-gamma-aminobutyrate hydrolase family protein [Thermodesulfobacteriota bacterium]
MKVLVFRHVPHEHLGTLESALKAADLNYRYINFFENKIPSISLEDYYALVILGGPMNVYETEDYPFLEIENKLIRQAVERQMPVLGICLGAQLIAKALGAKVTKNRVKEIGWYPLRISKEAKRDRLFKYFNTEETVFQWHGDKFEIPKGAVHLAESPLCRDQAFRFGPNVYALQFHIEVTPQMISEWLNVSENREEIKPLQEKINPETIITETPNYIKRLNALAENVFGEFCGLAKGR